jgi:hypothetical protein
MVGIVAPDRASIAAMTAVDEVRLLLEAKAQALVARRAGDLDDLIHRDFVYINAAGRTFDKAGYIDTYCTSGKVAFNQQRFDNLVVRLVDDFALATLVIEDELNIGGRIVSGRYQSLCVFSHASGRWLWAAGQTMTAAAA